MRNEQVCSPRVASSLVRRIAIGQPTIQSGERKSLTQRELEIVKLVSEGLSNKAVARRLGISAHTVKFHLEAVFAKLGAASRADAVARGLRGGLILL